MADTSALERALINADAAGDTAAAQTLASEIARLRSTSAPVQDQPSTPATPGVKRVYIGPEPSLAETGADALKSAGIGLAEGAIGLAGLPGDARQMASSATSFLGNALGANPSTIDSIKSAASAIAPGIFKGPTSADLQSGIEGVTGKFYEPQTTVGEFARTAGQFAPGMIGGTGGAGAKLLSRVAAPALASEGAGQLTKGTGLEPFARFGGAVLGGAGAAKLANPARVAAPTADALGDAASAAYKHPTVAALELNPSSMKFASSQITSGLNSKGFRELTAPQTYGLVKELEKPLGTTGRVADIQSVRTALGKVAGNFNNLTEQAAANKAIRGIDDYLAKLKPFDVAAGDAKAAASILNDAKANYAAKMRTTKLDNAEYRAELNTASAHSGGNINNATRQALKSILISPSKRRGFSAEEIAQMEKVVKGTATANVMRAVGKLLSIKGFLGAHIAAGSAATAPFTGGLSLAGLAIPAAGQVAKLIGNRSTANAIMRLDEMTAMRSPLGRALPAQLPSTNPAAAGLLSGLIESRSPR